MPLQALKFGDYGRELGFINTDRSERISTIPSNENGYWTNYVLEFGPDGMPIIPEVILSQRNGHKLGRIQNITGLRFIFNLNSSNEISFNIDLYHDGNKCVLWDEITDFKLVYVPLFNLWFEISISNSEDDSVVKMVTGESLNECELGQIMLYGVEINTEADILRDDYEPTSIYNATNSNASALNRLLEKAPHYKILHVDTSIAKLQRTFTFDNTSLIDAFNDISQEINCIFIYGDNDGSVVPRTISVYDLYDYCPVCEHREEHMDMCPDCGNKDIVHGYGKDTTIFASVENLADQINYSGDSGSVKNCFHLEAGDDLMTATVINCNPNGSAYLWNIPPEMRNDMSKELQDGLENYDDLYLYYQDKYEMQADPQILQKYNALIEKYKISNPELNSVSLPVVGYNKIIELYYNTIDFYGYLKNVYMPSPQFNDTSAEEQASFLTSSNLSPTSVLDVSYISLATANSAILSYAKVYVDTSRYQLTIVESSIDNVTWRGNFQVKSYSDEEDIVITDTITIVFNDDFEEFIRQKIDKLLSKNDQSEMGIVTLFHMENSDFSHELTKHCLSNLEIFYNACQSCIDILIENDIGNPDKWIDPDNNLYTKLYVPYTEKLNLISAEIKVRESELAIILTPEGNDSISDDISLGLENIIENERKKIMDALDFEKYLGPDLWKELLCFRREDSYSNSNYVSDGLSNSELIKNASQFISAAQKELLKASTLQHSISAPLKNLLIIPEFSPIVSTFKLGNWIRIKTLDGIYKLRLISYTLDFDQLDDINVEFSDVIKSNGTISDVQSILNQARNMATSYNAVIHQALKGSEANSALTDIAENGLVLTNIQIVSDASTQDIIYGPNGILCRSYDDTIGDYDPRQMKLIHRGLYFTSDNWKTAKAGLGEYVYYDPYTEETKTGYGLIAETIVGSIMLSESVGIYNQNQTVQIDSRGFVITAKEGSDGLDHLFTIQREDSSGDITKLFYIDSNGNANFDGMISAASGSKIGYWTIEDSAIYHTNPIWGSSDGKYFGDSGISITDKFKVDSEGNLESSGSMSIANGNLRYDTENGLRITGATITGTVIDFGYWETNDEGFFHGNQAWGSDNGQYLGKDGISVGNLFTVDSEGNVSLLANVSIGLNNDLYFDGTVLKATGEFTSNTSNISLSLKNACLIGEEDSTELATLSLKSDSVFSSSDSIEFLSPIIQISGQLLIDGTFSGAFQTQDNKTVTVSNGIIISVE